MNEDKKPKKKRKLKKWVYVLITMNGIAAALILIYLFFSNDILTIFSVKKISSAPAYEITYHGDYKLDQYLASDHSSPTSAGTFLKNNLLHGIGKLDYQNHGCSAFYAKTPDGDLIFARNYDAQGSTAAILKTDSGYQSLSISDLSWYGWSKTSKPLLFKNYFSLAAPYLTTDGMNENGVAAAVFTLKNAKTSADQNVTSVNDLAVLRLILDRATSVNNAIELLRQNKPNLSPSDQSHYMIADAGGNSAVIEYVDGQLKITNKNGNFQIISNFLLYGNNNPTLIGDGADSRYANYDSALTKANGTISTEAALKLLKENTVKGREQWSVVYNLTKKTMSVSFYGDYENVYTYSLK